MIKRLPALFLLALILGSLLGSFSLPGKSFAQAPTGSGREICDNGIDDDSDTFTDGEDPECYTLLEPLPGLTTVNTSQGLAPYVKTIFRLIIGLSGVAAVVLIVISGIQYMLSPAVFTKEQALGRIKGAILGLLLLLSTTVILRTINPELLNLSLEIKEVQVTVDGALFEQTEVPVTTAGQGYKMVGSFNNPQPSAGVMAFRTKIQSSYQLTDITVDVVAKTATFNAKKLGGSDTTSVTVPINIGKNGWSAQGTAVEGDGKTPKGITHITSDRRLTSGQAQAVFTKDGRFNMGAAFINTGATYNGKDRGIGFHGQPNNVLSVTNGCVRMYNDDLVVLAPYMAMGTKVIIQ